MTDTQDYSTPSLTFPYTLGKPGARADFRCSPEDFLVEEDLGFEPGGEGEHLLLHLKKRGENTGWLAKELANAFNIRELDIGYCGLKDRNAVTRQWFSLYLPKLSDEHSMQQLSAFEQSHPSITLLAHTRHAKKLRRGQHRANHFHIILRNLQPSDDLEKRLAFIAETGVPNYFGEQRFGRGGSNLYWARLWFEGGETIRKRSKRVMAQSAARSFLFNTVLAARVAAGNWNQKCFGDELGDTGPLWGRGKALGGEALNAFEAEQLAGYKPWMHGLEHVGSLQERRPLALRPEDFKWQLGSDSLELSLSFAPVLMQPQY